MSTSTNTVLQREQEIVDVMGPPSKRYDHVGRTILIWYGENAGQVTIWNERTVFAVYGTSLACKEVIAELSDPDCSTLQRRGIWMLKFYVGEINE